MSAFHIHMISTQWTLLSARHVGLAIAEDRSSCRAAGPRQLVGACALCTVKVWKLPFPLHVGRLEGQIVRAHNEDALEIDV